MKIEVSAVSGNEFGPNFVASSYDFSAMYFALDLKSITNSVGKESPLINHIECSYDLVTGTAELKEHSLRAGTSVTKLYLDAVKEPMLAYLSDTKKFKLSLDNVDFNAFTEGKAPHGQIIARGIPWAFVICPATGRYNPFQAISTISKIDATSGGSSIQVTRSCELVPFLEPPRNAAIPVLEKQYTFFEYGTYGVGPLSEQNINYDPDRSSYFYETSSNAYNNLYYSTSSGGFVSKPAFATPAITKRVNMIKNILKAKYTNKGYFTWWDVYSRELLKDYAESQLDMTTDVYKLLENGTLFDGPILKLILSSDSSETGIVLDVDSGIEDVPILSKFSRVPLSSKWRT